MSLATKCRSGWHDRCHDDACDCVCHPWIEGGDQEEFMADIVDEYGEGVARVVKSIVADTGSPYPALFTHKRSDGVTVRTHHTMT